MTFNIRALTPMVEINFVGNYAHGFYRAMHFSAKCGIAIACRLSVRPSVRVSVCL